MKRVLVIAYFFPPLGGVGIQRTLRVLRHLRDIGWEAEVLTVGASGYPYRDEAALASLPPDLAVHRVGAPDPERVQQALGTSLPGKAARKVLTEWLYPLMYVPDRFEPWARRAEAEAGRLLATGRFDLVYASVPPFSSTLTAVRAGRRSDVPVVLDFRDLWVASHYDPPHPLVRAAQERLEAEAVAGATRVICVTEGLAGSFRARYPGDANRVTVIRNGFESELFPESPPPGSAPELRLLHTGSLYGGRDLVPLIGGLAAFLDGRPDAEVRLRLVGSLPSRVTSAIEAASLDRVVERSGRVGHAESLRLLAESDAAVAVQVPGLDLDAVPMKIYEAMGLHRPVLLLGEEKAESARILERAGLLYRADPGDPASCERALEALYADKQAGRLGANIDEEYVASFDMRNQIALFGEVFDRAAGGS